MLVLQIGEERRGFLFNTHYRDWFNLISTFVMWQQVVLSFNLFWVCLFVVLCLFFNLKQVVKNKGSSYGIIKKSRTWKIIIFFYKMIKSFTILKVQIYLNWTVTSVAFISDKKSEDLSILTYSFCYFWTTKTLLNFKVL